MRVPDESDWQGKTRFVAILGGVIAIFAVVSMLRTNPPPVESQAPTGPSGEGHIKRDLVRADSIEAILTAENARLLTDSDLELLWRYCNSGPKNILIGEERRRRDEELRQRKAAERLQSLRTSVTGWESRNRVQELLSQHPEWSDDAITTIATKRIMIGFTAEQVIAAWGKPERTNRTIRASGVSEQWVYLGNYVYVDDGVVTVISESR